MPGQSPAMQIEALPATIPYRLARISVERYHSLVASGLIAEDDPIELLDGVLAEKARKNPRHVVATQQCDMALLKLLPAGWNVRIHDPVTLCTSEPEPDLVVVRGRLQDYSGRHPGSDDIGLVIEVADASLLTDRYKGTLYAGAGVPVYWIVNLVENVVEVYMQPDRSLGAYAYKEVLPTGDSLHLMLDGIDMGRIDINTLIPE